MEFTPGQRVYAPSPDETGSRVIVTVVSLGEQAEVVAAGDGAGTAARDVATIRYESGSHEGETATYGRDQLMPVDPDAPHPAVD